MIMRRIVTLAMEGAEGGGSEFLPSRTIAHGIAGQNNKITSD
jgi:hypothetical protein